MSGFIKPKSSGPFGRKVCSAVFAVALIFGLMSPAWGADQPQEKLSDTIQQLRNMAEKGSAEAQTKLADLYKDGKQVAQNLEESAKLYTKAAEKGFAEAQHKLGELYLEGKGVAQNSQEAVKWLQKAADQGYAAAKDKLAQLAAKAGETVQDLKKSFETDKR